MGSTRKSEWQSNPPHRGLELNVDSFDGHGRPDRECDRSRDGVHHEHRGGDADVRFAQLRQRSGERHPNVMVLYAGHPGGFVDLAADLERIPALGRARRVGRWLAERIHHRAAGWVNGLAELSVANQAIGMLITGGRTPAEARVELHRRAAWAWTVWSTWSDSCWPTALGNGGAERALVVLTGRRRLVRDDHQDVSVRRIEITSTVTPFPVLVVQNQGDGLRFTGYDSGLVRWVHFDGGGYTYRAIVVLTQPMANPAKVR
jgi:hypothetical protein